MASRSSGRAFLDFVMTAPFKRILIANRGEIAIRIARACAELDITSLAIFAEDDASSLHVRKADHSHALKGRGVAAYLDGAQILRIAAETGCDAIHPGYGFLAENAQFARACADAGICFIGPASEVLQQLGDKAQARALAMHLHVPVVAGLNRAISLAEAESFFASLPTGSAIMIKALAGGGGRGMRVVETAEALSAAFTQCQNEAKAAFGGGDVYVEQLVRSARHLEVQIAGDGTGQVVHFGERECSVQRRHQKLLEITPSPSLTAAVREQMIVAALKMAGAVKFQGLGTFEFLLDCDQPERFYFMEANPRLQVEHTITEAVSGVDLVQLQIQLAMGRLLQTLGLSHPPSLQGCAMQARINLETLHTDGSSRVAAGRLTAYEPPSGPGVRVDGYGYSGYVTSPAYDSLLAKVIVHANDYVAASRRLYRALCEFRLEGVASNVHFLQNLLRLPEWESHDFNTRFIDSQAARVLESAGEAHPHFFFAHTTVDEGGAATATLPHVSAAKNGIEDAPSGSLPLLAPSAGVLVSWLVQPTDTIASGQTVAILEAMKMEFLVKATQGGRVEVLQAQPGAALAEGVPILFFTPLDNIDALPADEETIDLAYIRADLAEVIERHAITLDARRPDAVARRRRTGQCTTRENLAALLDADSFIEYGALALAAQRRRRSTTELLSMSPADGLIAGLGTINAAHFGEEAARCMVLAYDYTVFAGTQGMMNHKKTDRMLQLAERWRIPLVLFAEGGGGRPGDSDYVGVSGLDCPTFAAMARLSGKAPIVGVVSGRCFAGNAALLGCCDVIIATRNASIGMAGPAMIEGGGLGKVAAEEVGPVSMQAPNGVIDIVVDNEPAAVQAAKQYLSYFQGQVKDWQCADQRELRYLIPENRLRVYDIRRVIATLADTDSVLELRREFAAGMITALIRIEGRSFGLIANNPAHLGGAIDADAGDKAARFLQLCDAFGLPILSLCDTPGFMVGPAAEKQATVRHVSRMFVVAANLKVPFLTVVLRKGYGLGAQSMAAGSFHAALFTVAWPTGEFGAMGLEGAIRLGYAKELAAIDDPQRRERFFRKMVGRAYRAGKGINMASYLEIDDVIDPMETRRWVLRGVKTALHTGDEKSSPRGFVDTW